MKWNQNSTLSFIFLSLPVCCFFAKAPFRRNCVGGSWAFVFMPENVQGGLAVLMPCSLSLDLGPAWARQHIFFTVPTRSNFKQ